MRGFRKVVTVLIGFSLALSSFAAQIGMVATAANEGIAGVPPSIDPTINKEEKLPEDHDQAMIDGMPNGVFVIGKIGSSSYGVATGSDGEVYYADYSGTVRVKYPDKLGYVSLLSEEKTIETGISQLYAIAIDADGNLVYGKDGENANGHVGIYNMKTQEKTEIISGLTRPRQIALDQDGNVYVVCEDGAIKKWDKAAKTVSAVTTNLFGAQGIAVLPDGTIYVLCYSRHSDTPLIGVSYSGGKLYQINNGKAVAVAGGDTQYVWRARGLTTDEHGYLYVSGESNAWDNGNSSLFARFNPGKRTLENVLTGLDFSTYNAYGKDGRFYMPLARDEYMVAYSEKAAAEFADQDWTNTEVKGARISTYGGTYQPAAGDANLTINIESLTLTGKASVSTGSDKVSGWIKVPAESLPEVDKTMIPHPEESPMPGMYVLPEATVTVDSGEAAVAVIPLREHVRARWPLVDLYHAAEDFSEAPEAYLVYFEWTPHDLDTYTPPADKEYNDFLQSDMEPADPPYVDNVEDRTGFDFSDSAADVTKAGDVHVINFNGANAYTVCTGSNVSFKFRFVDPDPKDFDWIGFALDNSGSAGLGDGDGLRGILGRDSYSSTIRLVETSKGKGWDAVAGTQQVMDGPIVENGNDGKGFNDGKWHTMTINGESGTWSMKIDDVEVFRNKYENFDSDMTRLLGGTGETYLTFYSSSLQGGIEIEEIIPEAPFEKMDFSASEATVTVAGDVTELAFNGKNAFAAADMNGLEFEFRWTDANFDWMGLALSNSGSHGLGDGEGVRAIVWKSVPNATVRVVDTANGEGWDAVAGTQTIFDGPVAGSNPPADYSFADGEWHTIKIEKAEASWSIKLDGYELIQNRYAACDADLDQMIGGDNAVLTVFTASGQGKVEIRQKAPVNKDGLFAKIATAEELLENTTAGNRPGQVAQNKYDALEQAVADAKVAADSDSADQAAITAAVEALNTAIYDFTMAIVPPTDFTALEAKITEAQGMKEKTGVGTDAGKAPQAAHDALQTAISAANTVADNADALQTEVDQALAALEVAVKAFVAQIVLADDVIAFDFVGAAGIDGAAAGTVTVGEDSTALGFIETGSLVYTQVTGTKLDFSFKVDPSETFEWFGMNLSNNGMAMLGGGNGLSTLFWRASYGLTSRVVEDQPGKGWDAAVSKQIHDGGIADELARSFSDGEWHHVVLEKTAGGWMFTIDGIDVVKSRYDGFDDDMDRLLGGSNTVTMTLFTNSTAGTIHVFQDIQSSGLNVTALNNLITEAEQALADETDDRIPQSAKNALDGAIVKAKAVIADEDSVQADVEAQKEEMAAALAAFEKVVSDVAKTRELSAAMDALEGTVTEDNLYDAVLLQDTFDTMTAEQQALLPEAEKTRLSGLVAQAKTILRTDNGITIEGDELPYYIAVRVTPYTSDAAEWDEIFTDAEHPALLFGLQLEDYLTGAEHTADKPFTLKMAVPESFKEYKGFQVVLPNGKIVNATAKDGVITLTAEEAGFYALSATSKVPATGVDLSFAMVMTALIGTAVLVLTGIKRKGNLSK